MDDANVAVSLPARDYRTADLPRAARRSSSRAEVRPKPDSEHRARGANRARPARFDDYAYRV
jgi:hypothetical protein